MQQSQPIVLEWTDFEKTKKREKMKTTCDNKGRSFFTRFNPWFKSENKVNGSVKTTSGEINNLSEQIDEESEITKCREIDSTEKMEDKSVETITNKNHKSSLVLSNEDNPWSLIGGSVTGNGHKIDKTPCQDSHRIEAWIKGWGVAVVSDGAGSAENSQLASSFLTEETARRAALLVKKENWIENNSLPNEEEWKELSKKLFGGIQDSLIGYSKGIDVPIKSLHATLIMIIYSPLGLLVAHVGDGRAGCIGTDDEWISIINPFEGEQMGETVFMTLDFESNENFFESRVTNKPVKAFFMLSDGCEDVCWETIQKDEETGGFFKPNKPFEPFFKQTISVLQNLSQSNKSEGLQQKWMDYLESGHKGFQTETDDKTMVIGILEQ